MQTNGLRCSDQSPQNVVSKTIRMFLKWSAVHLGNTHAQHMELHEDLSHT